MLVHEWLERSGGSENVFEAMIDIFPDASRWCLWNDGGDRFRDVHETLLARTPLRKSKVVALPVMPPVWRHLPTAKADWILVSSHLFAHHARFQGPARQAPKLVYAHTPARYIWEPELDGRGNGFISRAASRVLKRIDKHRSKEATAIAANSQFVADRIERVWERESQVIYPPVSVERFATPPNLSPSEQRALDRLPTDFLLGVSRFVPYKRLDAAIEAGRLSGLPVVLAGSGPDEARLRELAERLHPGRVTFVERPTTPLLNAIYRRAAALVFAPIEDFGIVPVEAMAAGTPVIANAIGGASETVIAGVTGALVLNWSSRTELTAAIDLARACAPSDCLDRARRFDIPEFENAIKSFVNEHAQLERHNDK
jgi:glycosyltransferase involved in cell wall biosynthesis